jgi:dihydroorotate dehydrogenase
MGFCYEKLIRPVLFRMDAERAHELSVDCLAFLAGLTPVCRLLESLGRSAEDPVRLFGLTFPNRIGMAAGYDKNGRAWPAAAALGFGHVEIGTITARPQPGNPAPRLFRYPPQKAVINRMGFNNDGAARVAARLSHQPARGQRRIPLGINLGKSKAAHLDQAVQDYLASFSSLADFADYLVLNVSSPNTPGLRALQDEDRLRELLGAIRTANRSRATQPGRGSIPVLLKIAPDLGDSQIDAVLTVVNEFELDGIIATNTTVGRPAGWSGTQEAGGLSGGPLRERSTEVIRHLVKGSNGRLPVVGVGGIGSVDDAKEKLDAGASLVQVYTGMIYRGPFFARHLARGLKAR